MSDKTGLLLSMIAHSAVQSPTRTLFTMFIDPSTMLDTTMLIL